MALPLLTPGCGATLEPTGLVFKMTEFHVFIHFMFIHLQVFGSPCVCGAVGVLLCCVVWRGVVSVSWRVVVWCAVVCSVVLCCDVVLFDALWCVVVWCGVVWCGVVWRGVVWCGVVWCVW